MSQHKRYPQLVASFSSFAGADNFDAVNTAAFKVGGSAYGALLGEILPMVDKLAKVGKLPAGKDLYFSDRKAATPTALAIYILTGRSEGAHARGKKLCSGIAGSDGDKTSEQIVKDRAEKYAARVREAYATLTAAPVTEPVSSNKRKAK